MSFEYSPYLLPLIAAAIVSATVAVYALGRQSSTGARPLALMALAIFIWTVGYSLEIAGKDLETKYLWGVIQYFGIAFAPYGWFLFSIIYSDRKKLLTRRFVVLTVLIPAITVLLALTTRWNGLIWSEYHSERQGNFSALSVTHGAWFIVHFAYSYLILMLGTIFVSIVLLRRKGMYRGQVLAMLVAVLAPWISNFLYLTGNSPIPYLDPTPFAFAITVAALAWAIFGFHLVDITPLARDRVIDSMRDGMVVLNARGQVADINDAAARMIGIPAGDAIGKSAAEVFSPWSHLVERFRNVLDAKDEITVGEGEAKRHFEVNLSPLEDQQGKLVGRVIMLRPIAGEETLPKPRFAPREAVFSEDTKLSPDFTANDNSTAKPLPKKSISLWDALVDFYRAPVKKELVIPPDINPSWYQTRERLFTVIVRFAAVVGTISLVLTVSELVKNSMGPFILFVIILMPLWGLGLTRNVKYESRVVLFLFIIYCLGFIETLNFGFSVESFTFFMAFATIAAVLTSRRGAIHALLAALITLGTLGILIGSRIFIPYSKAIDSGLVSPASVQAAFSSLLAFAASASGVLAAVVILLENLNKAWQKEAQALNLLQQERDLLEQRVEERAKELRKYFRAIEQSGNTIVITDTKGNIEYANPRFEQSTGYSLAEALGNNPRVLKSGRQSAEYYNQLWQTISSGKVWTGEFLNKRKDGSLYWEFATIAPVLDQDGIITNYVAIKEDITARRKAEEQLQKLSQAVEQSGNTVIIMDKNGLIEYVNPKFTEVTGYASEDALGKSPAVLMNGIAQDFRQADWWLTINTGQIWHGEFRNHRKDGSEFWESATIAPVVSHDGEVINFVEIKQDITDQKILQEQLQKQNDYLSVLHQITLDLLNHRELADLLQIIVDRSAVLLDAPYSELMLEKDGFLIVESFTPNQQSLKGDRVTREQARLSWQAFDTQKPVILEDYSTWEYRRQIYDAQGLHATADFPVLAGDRCLGVLALGRPQPNYTFTPDQIDTGVLFARLVALVLDNANLYDSAMKELAERKRAEAQNEAFLRDIKALQEVYLELSEIDDLQELYRKMIGLAQYRLGLDRIGMFVINEHSNELQGTCGVDQDGQIRDESYYHEPITENHWTLEITEAHNHTHLWEDAPVFDNEKEIGRGWKSAAALWNGHRAIGYLVADNFTSQRPARPYEEELISLLGSTFGHLIENKRNEARIQESEARFRQIVENASDIIYRVDIQGNFTYLNPAALKIAGFTNEEDALGKSCYDVIVPEYRSRIKRLYFRQYHSRTKSHYTEFPILTMDGHVVWIGQNMQLIMDSEEIVGFQAVSRNITQLKQAQEALELSRDQALDASRFKSQLLSRVSHELRTPLGGILGYAELLDYQMFGPLTDKQNSAVKNILESTNYLSHIVNDLLDEAQIESKSLVLRNDYYKPVDLLDKIKSTMAPLAEKKGLQFTAVIDHLLPVQLYGDANRLQQIIINLTGNAVKFTKEGNVSLNFKCLSPTQWSIEVSDTGAGIPALEQQNIFEPFRQVDNSITRENRGSGLGLAITKQLVELMGGRISLDSEVDKGSLFTVVLPISEAPGEASS